MNMFSFHSKVIASLWITLFARWNDPYHISIKWRAEWRKGRRGGGGVGGRKEGRKGERGEKTGLAWWFGDNMREGRKESQGKGRLYLCDGMVGRGTRI